MDILKIKNDKDFRLKSLPATMRPGFKPREFQHRAILMAVVLKSMALAYDVGLGKTAICLTSFAFLEQKKKVSKLFVFTLSSALYQWKNEAEKFTLYKPLVIDTKVRNKCLGNKKRGDFKEQAIKELQDSLEDGASYTDKQLKDKIDYLWRYYKHTCRKELYQKLIPEHDMFIMTYEIMKKDFFYYKPYLKDSLVVWDEVLKLKNRNSKTYKCAEAIIAEDCRRIGASATLLKNNMEETWSIFSLICPPKTLPSEQRFINHFCVREAIRIGRRKVIQTTGYRNDDEFKSLIEPFYISCQKHDVPEHVPELEFYPLYCDLTSTQKTLYRTALESVLEIDEEKDLIGAVTRILRCQQIVNYPNVIGYPEMSSKESLLLDLLEDEPDIVKDKVVIFTRFKSGVKHLVESTLVKYNPLYIHGDVKSNQRQEAMDLFNKSKDRNIIVINTAASSAVNLQGGANLIQYDLDWSFGENHQIIGRINRLNSVHAINKVFMLMVTDSVDEYVYHKVISKQNSFDNIFDNPGYTLDPNGMKMFVKSFKDYHNKYRPY